MKIRPFLINVNTTHLIVLGQMVGTYITEILWKGVTLCIPSFKVTQGHWN